MFRVLAKDSLAAGHDDPVLHALVAHLPAARPVELKGLMLFTLLALDL